MAAHEYTVSSASQYTGAKSLPSSPESDDSLRTRDKANQETSMLKRRSAIRRSVRFTASTKSEEEGYDSDVFTQSGNTSSDSGSESSIPVSPVESTEERDEHGLEMLLPARYSPQQTGSAEREHSPAVSSIGRSLSHVSVPDRVKEYEAQMTLEHRRRISKSAPQDNNSLAIDTGWNSHRRNVSNSSVSSRRGRQQGDIYFTPTEATKSQVFLSSPKGSPTMPDEENLPLNDDDGEIEQEEGSHTPRATLSRPPSAIFVGATPLSPLPVAPRRPKPEKLAISAKELDQLITALVKSSLVQKHVRKHWWDEEDIPDDETIVSYTSITTPTLTSASTLYSRPNEAFLNGEYFPETGQVRARDFATLDSASSYENKKLPTPPKEISIPFGGVALADPKIHGVPIRFISRTYRLGGNVLSVGSCTFLNVPYGSDVESALRIEQPGARNGSCRVMLQCVNQVVERKSGRKIYLLVAEVDVTAHFAEAAIAELARVAENEVELAPSPTQDSPLASPDIDWTALADELQNKSYISDLIDSLIPTFSPLSLSPLLSHLTALSATHQDFLILKPSSQLHPNGIPLKIRIPYISARLYHDWYEKDNAAHGNSAAAGRFQREVVEMFAKGEFEGRVNWGEEVVLGVKGVEVGDGVGGVVWVVFVQGEVE